MPKTRCAEFAPELEEEPTSVKWGKVQVWREDDGEVKKNLATYVANMKSPVHEMIVKADEQLLGHERWNGTMIQVDSLTADSGGLFDEIQNLSDAAKSPWLVSIKVNRMRLGPAAVCLPGVGHMVRMERGSCAMFLFPVAPVLSEGLSLNDVAKIFDTNKGCDFFNECGFVVTLDKGDVLVVPWGYFAVPIYILVGKQGAKEANPAHMMMFPLWIGKSASECSAEVRRAIRTYNLPTLTDRKGNKTYKERMELFTGFMDKVDA